jgi:hypothetical protein
MPPAGNVPFPLFRDVARDDIIRVLEPSATITGEEIVSGLKLIREAWDAPASHS